MDLKIPHNYFTVWMITPSRELGGARPVDVLKDSRAPLQRALEAGGRLHPAVVDLFSRAMELKIPHNNFTVWMITPSRDLGGARPVDVLKDSRAAALLRRALETLGKTVGAH
jgi:uncharacterized protein (DUF2384 family)